MLWSMLLVLSAWTCTAMLTDPQGVLSMQTPQTDRRVPYYVLPGCNYMVDAGAPCDGNPYPGAIGCCPIGFECSTSKTDKSKGRRCLPSTPTYNMSPNCSVSKRAAVDAICSSGSCCPDGLECVSPFPRDAPKCSWTGRVLVPPPGYKTKPSQMFPKGARTMAPDAGMTGNVTLSMKDRTGSGDSEEADRQGTCRVGALCPATTLVQSGKPGCSKGGRRWQAPSCRCYDIPAPAMLKGAPQPLDVDSKTGRWVIRNTTKPASIQGINWFGFNNGQTMVDGLWADYRNATLGDFPTVLKRIKLLGFNGLRLPFTFDDLNKPPSQDIYAADCTTDTIRQFRLALSPTYTSISSSPRLNLAAVYTSSSSCPYDTKPTETKQGKLTTSNRHVPGKQDRTTHNRFLWLIQYAVGQGFYVVIDFHFEQDNLQNNPSAFAAEWRRLWSDITSLPTYKSVLSGRVFPEVVNEWDKFGCRWDSTTSTCKAPYRRSIEAAAAAIRDVTRAAGDTNAPIILVNGVGQLTYGFNWGDGFVTDSKKIAEAGLSNPRGFFANDNAAKNRYKIVLAPHVYGSSITFQTPAATSGDVLFERLFASWGSKNPAANLGRAGIKQQYAVAVTEFGSDCDLYSSTTNGKCAGQDNGYLRDVAAYIMKNGKVAKSPYKHNRASVWFWWSWNANSGDTGGLVVGSDAPAPWYSVKWYKVRYLETVGLCPWYKKQGSCK